MAEQKKIKPSLRNLAAGDVIFREGEVGDFAYQVVKGKIEVTKFNGDEYVTLALLEKGALFGEMALIDKQPRSAMARAVDEATVREIDKDALLGYLKNSPQTAFNMMQQLASYARNANEKLSVDAFSSEENAKRLKLQVSQLGHDVSINKVDSNGKIFYAVRINRYKSKRKAEEIGKDIKSKLGVNYRVLYRPS